MPAQEFTKYEIARIIGARALQIAMDAPIILKISEEDLKELKYDSIKIAEKEFAEDVLPIAIHRPSPRRSEDKLKGVKEEHVSDEELKEKEKEVEKEISEEADKLGFVNAGDADESSEEEVDGEEV
jgi:DNA-directed RNA polymerase subunit K